MKKYTYYFADGTTSTVEVSDELFDVMTEYDIADIRARNRQKYNLDVALSEKILAQPDGKADYPPTVYRQLEELNAQLDRSPVRLTPQELNCVNAYLRTGSLRKAARETYCGYMTIKRMLDSVVAKLNINNKLRGD